MVLAFHTPPFDDVTVVELESVPLAVVRHNAVTIDDVQGIFDEGFTALGAAIGYGTLQPTGPALAVYRGDPMATFDLEIGFPVAEALPGPIEREQVAIVPSDVPAGSAAALTYRGAYDGLSEGWRTVVAGASETGAAPSGIWIEVYVDDPSEIDDPRTDLVMPLRS